MTTGIADYVKGMSAVPHTFKRRSDKLLIVKGPATVSEQRQAWHLVAVPCNNDNAPEAKAVSHLSVATVFFLALFFHKGTEIESESCTEVNGSFLLSD